MTLEELARRIDDAVNALERIADVLEDVTDNGRLNVGGRLVTVEDRP